MKTDTRQRLCCPTCRGELALTITIGSQEDVTEGNLHCPPCHTDYPIKAGIPDMLPPDLRAHLRTA